jgi:Holliday junction resolvase
LSNPSKEKGSKAEREVVAIFQEHGFPEASRGLAGATKDRGDIENVPGLCCEVKNHSSVNDAASVGLREIALEKENRKVPYGVVFVRRRGGKYVAIMEAVEFVKLYSQLKGPSS